MYGKTRLRKKSIDLLLIYTLLGVQSLNFYLCSILLQSFLPLRGINIFTVIGTFGANTP